MTSSSLPLRVGLVGYGSVSRVFHVPLLRRVPELQLTALVSRQPQAARDVPEAQVFGTLDDLLLSGLTDIVIVATPNDTHAPLAAQALAGGQHVVVEKPFTLETAQAQALADAAGAAGRVLTVFQNRRFDSDFRTVQRVVASGELGEVRVVASHFDRFRPQVRRRWREGAGPGAGIWYDLAPHLLDQALLLFGTPQRLLADLAALRPGAQSPDHAVALLDYGDKRVTLHASLLTPAPAPRWTLHGTGGTLTLEGLDGQEAALQAGLDPAQVTDPAGLLETGEVRRAVPREPGDYTEYYRQLARAVRGEGPPPVTLAQALAVMRLLDAGRQSAAQGGWVVTG